jgi:hypothetical protein
MTSRSNSIGRLTSGAPFGDGADNALFTDAKGKAAGLVTAGKIDAAAADRVSPRRSPRR